MSEEVGESISNLTEEDGPTLEAEPEKDQTAPSPAPVKKTPRFMVENVESPTRSSPTKSKDAAAEFGYPDPAETIGFATHEAVPMTLFYRNASSLGDGAVQRPTLKELHEGFDILDEEMVG